MDIQIKMTSILSDNKDSILIEQDKNKHIIITIDEFNGTCSSIWLDKEEALALSDLIRNFIEVQDNQNEVQW